MKVKKKQHEQLIQMAIVQWFRLIYPNLRDCLSASANGGKRETKIIQTKKGTSKYCSEGARLKKMGVLAGELDIFISLINSAVIDNEFKVYGGLYVEVKAPGGKLTKEQKRIIKIREASGYKVNVCFAVDEAMAAIKEYMENAVLPNIIVE